MWVAFGGQGAANEHSTIGEMSIDFWRVLRLQRQSEDLEKSTTDLPTRLLLKKTFNASLVCASCRVSNLYISLDG